jgi:ABC transport system ATP-binding/permease protein
VYLIPTLESKLAYCLNNRRSWRNPNDVRMTSAFELLRNEITYELEIVGHDKLPEVDNIQIRKFDSVTYVKTSAFLRSLRQFYTKRLDHAVKEKDSLVSQLTANPEQTAVYQAFHDQYVNEAVTDAVKNMTSTNRIVEYDGKLIQKIYPIYMDVSRPSHLFDFSANLYQPKKHFAGLYFDTFYFNIAVIWSMTIFLFVTLYFDVLKKIIRLLEGNRKYRKRERH